jgi:hypothetical protein
MTCIGVRFRVKLRATDFSPREFAMRLFPGVLLLPAVLALMGCETASQILDDEQAVATQTALRRGQFELACPQATARPLSQSLLQPAAWGGYERAEYTIGIEGCGKRSTYVVVCVVGSTSCFAASGLGNRAVTP